MAWGTFKKSPGSGEKCPKKNQIEGASLAQLGRLSEFCELRVKDIKIVSKLTLNISWIFMK